MSSPPSTSSERNRPVVRFCTRLRAATGLCRLLIAVLGCSPCPAGLNAVWAVGDGEKIDRDQLNSPLKTANSVWDGKVVRLYAARNEIVAFQVIAEADSQGISGLSAALPALVHAATGSRIAWAPPAEDPTDYRGRDILLFSVNYMQVNQPTSASWIYRPGPGAPSQPTGWKPVQLVPQNARAGRGGFPVAVPPSRNQSLWVEVYTGRDRPAGLYRGTLTLEADQVQRTLPVELRVFDFNLPEANSIRPMVYFESEQPLLYQGRRLDDRYHRFAHRHRIELVNAYSIASAQSAAGRFLGTDFREDQGYQGPGEGVGNVIIPATFYGPGTDFDDRQSAWRRSDEWITFLEAHFQTYLTFVYLPDEPDSSQWATIRRIADNLHSNPGPGRRLPVFITSAFTAALDGWIDYWCSPPQLYDQTRAEKERAKGHEYWIYNGGRPFVGAVVIDAPATDPRAIIWACFKHGIDLYFYWHSVHWQHNHQMRPGVSRNQNVWANPITFDNGTSFANGDGVLIYPGTEVLHPDQDRGIQGPVATVQLANFRRGLQDHQYLTLARSLGLDTLVDEALKQVVPLVFSDTDTARGIGFAEREQTFETARRLLGENIEAARIHRRRR